MGHMIESAIVHGVIYRVIFEATRRFGLPGCIAFAVAGIAGVAIYRRCFGNDRRARRRDE